MPSLMFPDSARFLSTASSQDGSLTPAKLECTGNGNGHNPTEIRPQSGNIQSSTNSSALNMQVSGPPGTGKRETTAEIFSRLQRLIVEDSGTNPTLSIDSSGKSHPKCKSENLDSATSENVAKTHVIMDGASTQSSSSENTTRHATSHDLPREIPTYELSKLEYSNPILLVEGLAAEGRRHGAIKVKMPDAYVNEKRSRLEPELFVFKTKKLVNTSQDVVYRRLQFYHELIKHHTQTSEVGNSLPRSEGPSKPEGQEGENLPEASSNNLFSSLGPTRRESKVPGLQKQDSMNLQVEDSDNQDLADTHTPLALDFDLKLMRKRALILDTLQSLEGLSHESSKISDFLTSLPVLELRPLDLYDLFRIVKQNGGYTEVSSKNKWAKIGRGLGYRGEVSPALQLTYASILYPLEVSCGENSRRVKEEATTSSGEESLNLTVPPFTDQDSSNIDGTPSHKKHKPNSAVPLIVGSACEYSRSLRLKSSKGFLLNQPRLIDVKAPVLISANAPEKDPTTKDDKFIMPLGAKAQINTYLKWLVSFLSIMQDAPEHEYGSRVDNTYTLRLFMEKDSLFQECVLEMYCAVFKGLSWEKLAAPSENDLRVSVQEMEYLFWKFMEDFPAEAHQLENCTNLPVTLADGDLASVGDGFLRAKAHLYATCNADQRSDCGNGKNELREGRDGSTDALSAIKGRLNPFELSNLPFQPNSLFGVLSGLDINNDMHTPHLDIGMTFSMQNWRSEDHFTQLCSYHTFGKAKQWFFIPELEFEKFEELLQELTLKSQTDLRDMKSSTASTTLFQQEYVLNCLKSTVGSFPLQRARNDNPVFQKLTESAGPKLALNQGILITPTMLTERGIMYHTTTQMPGEMIFTYPKAYSASISLGFNVSEEVNFASNLWLDYSVAGEKWLQKRGIIPNLLVFKLLANFAQLMENPQGNNANFSPEVHSKAHEVFTALFERELALRNEVRGRVKLKEIITEDRSTLDADFVTDDDFLNAPSKVLIHSVDSNLTFTISLQNFISYLNSPENSDVNMAVTGLLEDRKYRFELHLFYSDERLRSFQRIFQGFSVDFDSWMTRYDEMMSSEDEMVLKNYKLLLQEGQKICAALTGVHTMYERFCRGGSLSEESLEKAKQVQKFKNQVETLRVFVDESSAIVEQCHAIISLKHQQRIRNGGNDHVENHAIEHPGSLQLLVEVANKISRLNFYAPEFDLVLEYKNEILNFDKACRMLIEQGTAQAPEMKDMIDLGTSFGITIPSLSLLIRLNRRLEWVETHDVIVTGGDPFVGKKEIFSLPDLKNFRDRGLEVLAGNDVPKLKTIEKFLKEGRAYDDAVKLYLSRIGNLNDVNLPELEARISDMEERSKLKGPDRLFVELSTYQKLIDLKSQEKQILFLQSFSQNDKAHSLFDIRQHMQELAGCTFACDSSNVSETVAASEKWLQKVEALVEQVPVIQRQSRAPTTLTKISCNVGLATKLKVLVVKARTAFSSDTIDVFEYSSPYLYVYDLQDEFAELSPVRYCMCREYEDGTMVECDFCHEWFHVTCVKDLGSIPEKDDDKYTCPGCVTLASYQNTSQYPPFAGKIKENALLALIQEGDLLKVKPVVELSHLKELWSIAEQAQNWFFQPVMRLRFAKHGFLYQKFLLRKFLGSPVLLSPIVTFLLNSLKFIDLPTAFDKKPRPKGDIGQIEMAAQGKLEGNTHETSGAVTSGGLVADQVPVPVLAPVPAPAPETRISDLVPAVVVSDRGTSGGANSSIPGSVKPEIPEDRITTSYLNSPEILKLHPPIGIVSNGFPSSVTPVSGPIAGNAFSQHIIPGIRPVTLSETNVFALNTDNESEAKPQH